MKRRDALRSLSMAGGASLLSTTKGQLSQALTPEIPSGFLHPGFAQAIAGTAPIKIRDIKTILTAPNSIRLVVVKVETTEPGLVGWGCATFTQRALVVQTAIDQYLKPFLVGRNVDEIEDIWQSCYVSSYWRNGPVLFNAMSGVDIALWDIKGKRAGMPLYQLLGGKVRHGADCYFHASGSSFAEVGAERAKRRWSGASATCACRVDAGLRRLRRARDHRRGGRARRGDRSDQSARHLGVGSLRADAAQALRAPAQQARRRGRAAARRARADHAEPGDQPVQGARAVSICSSSRIRSRRRRTITSGCCGSRRASRSPWASCSTRSTSTCRSSRTG